MLTMLHIFREVMQTFPTEMPSSEWLKTMDELTTTQSLLEKKMEKQALLDRQFSSSFSNNFRSHSYESSEWIWTPNIMSKELETLQRFNDLEHLLEQEKAAHGILVSEFHLSRTKAYVISYHMKHSDMLTNNRK